jgi:hypothetical protein
MRQHMKILKLTLLFVFASAIFLVSPIITIENVTSNVSHVGTCTVLTECFGTQETKYGTTTFLMRWIKDSRVPRNLFNYKQILETQGNYSDPVAFVDWWPNPLEALVPPSTAAIICTIGLSVLLLLKSKKSKH